MQANQQKNECFGMAKENHTNFHQETSGSFTLNLSQVSAQEKVPFFDNQRGVSSPPIWIPGSLLWISYKLITVKIILQINTYKINKNLRADFRSHTILVIYNSRIVFY